MARSPIPERLVERLLLPGAAEATAAAASGGQRERTDHDKEYVGFATLPNQVHRKSVKKGFEFTLMVAGESGLGKSTLINSLFLTDLYHERVLLPADERISRTVEILRRTLEIEEKGVRLRLSLVDTPGFADAIDNTECWQPVVEYVEEQFESYFREESGLDRKSLQDTRVHCCLYFISPYGHGLKPLDVEFMKALHNKVNIVPVIAKADTLTMRERETFKRRVQEELSENDIKIYQFPECDSDEDEEFKRQDEELKASIPFAVIGGSAVVEASGRRVRGRLYPWGIAEVDSSEHCDLAKLRTMLIRTHMQDLKDVTRDLHYEEHRARCIQHMTRVATRTRSKLSRESVVDFPTPIVSGLAGRADALIRAKEQELARMQEMLVHMQNKVQAQSNQSST
ncbi:septin-5-like isoform X1 [Lampetra fluviatilis]